MRAWKKRHCRFLELFFIWKKGTEKLVGRSVGRSVGRPVGRSSGLESCVDRWIGNGSGYGTVQYFAVAERDTVCSGGTVQYVGRKVKAVDDTVAVDYRTRRSGG